jgi:hypothetical protein
MKKEEEIAHGFLLKQGFESVVYEPLGKSSPPDFEISDNIAIEVRRLNKYVDINGRLEPIENLLYEFVPKFNRLLRGADNPQLSITIGVSLTFNRPIKVSKELLSQLKESIISSTAFERFSTEIKFSDHITYALFETKGRSDQTYYLLSIYDEDRGGKVQISRYNSLKISIAEKSRKLAPIKKRYKKLWLILIDYIFYRVDYTTKQDLEKESKIDSIFDRIILISSIDQDKWIDLYPWKTTNN